MEDAKLTSTLGLLLIAVASCFFVFNRFVRVKQDVKEPAFVHSMIPYIGHIIGLFWYKNRYYAKLSAQYHLPIYSLAMPGGRVYVVNSPDLVVSLQRQPKIVSFWFIEGKFTARLGAMSKEASELILKDLQGDQPSRSLLLEGMRATHTAMMPGGGINDMLHVTAKATAAAMDRFEMTESARRIDLWKWVQHEMTAATTESVYGEMNPYRDPKFEAGFWNFAGDTIMLLAGVMPSFLASKAFAGRNTVVAAFENYFAANGHETGSCLVKARTQLLSPKMGANDLARFECVNGIALLANTVPTAFWTFYHVFSDPKILETVRGHMTEVLTVEEKNGTTCRTLDLSKVRETSILASILQEVLRHQSSGTGPRMIMEDILLDDRYFLKRDSYLILHNHDLHFDENAWGATARNFDSNRFLKSKSKKIHSGAFRGFGGGANLCPGKAFATTEIVAMVAVFALRFDLRPVSGQWIEPQQDTSNMSLAIAPPKKKVILDVVPRQGWEGGSWAFKF